MLLIVSGCGYTTIAAASATAGLRADWKTTATN